MGGEFVEMMKVSSKKNINEKIETLATVLNKTINVFSIHIEDLKSRIDMLKVREIIEERKTNTEKELEPVPSEVNGKNLEESGKEVIVKKKQVKQSVKKALFGELKALFDKKNKI